VLDPAHPVFDPEHLGATIAWLGFGLAFVFGAVAHRVNFCTMGAVSDVINIGDWGRMRMWLLAIAVAMLAANLLHLFGYVDGAVDLSSRALLLAVLRVRRVPVRCGHDARQRVRQP
jgi:hypothetical protein